MSDDDDKESRTEEATEKKTRNALERGDAPVSRDINLGGFFLGLLLALGFSASDPASEGALRLGVLLGAAGDARHTAGEWVRLLAAVAATSAVWIGPFVLTIAGASLCASVAQSPPRIVWRRMKPDFSRIDPVKGFARTAGSRSMADVGKSALKVVMIAVISSIAMWSRRKDIVGAWQLDASAVAALVGDLCASLAVAVVAAFALVGVGDLVFARRSWRKRLRMTRQELKDELKQSEGDPLVKSRLRSLASDRARRRMIADVEKASFVILNPVHYAVALRYVRAEGGAPVVVAKGQELLALRIRERAEAKRIPTIENPALARSLYGQVEVGQMIPVEFYRAIAEIVNAISKAESA